MPHQLNTEQMKIWNGLVEEEMAKRGIKLREAEAEMLGWKESCRQWEIKYKAMEEWKNKLQIAFEKEEAEKIEQERVVEGLTKKAMVLERHLAEEKEAREVASEKLDETEEALEEAETAMEEEIIMGKEKLAKHLEEMAKVKKENEIMLWAVDAKEKEMEKLRREVEMYKGRNDSGNEALNNMSTYWHNATDERDALKKENVLLKHERAHGDLAVRTLERMVTKRDEEIKDLRKKREWLIHPWTRDDVDVELESLGWKGRKLTDEEWDEFYNGVPDGMGVGDVVNDTINEAIREALDEILGIHNKEEMEKEKEQEQLKPKPKDDYTRNFGAPPAYPVPKQECLNTKCDGTTQANWCDDCIKVPGRSQHASYPYEKVECVDSKCPEEYHWIPKDVDILKA